MGDDLRGWLGEQIRWRVVGPDAEKRRGELFDTDEPGWFDNDAPIRRVHGDASMFVGGLRALLLQSLHPLAMAGVADHSDYRHDPWGRLQRTADFLTATTFGPSREAERAVERVRSVHGHVRGTAPDGRPYSADDPHLLRWVHIAEVDSFLAAHDRYGRHRLHRSERDVYLADAAQIAVELGAVDPPTTERELSAQLREYRKELAGTRQARDAARYLLVQPPMPLAARPAYGMIAAAAVALLPRWSRPMLRVPWLPITETMAIGPAGDLVTRTMRWAIAPQPIITD
jgi:uncharacterized protein (DUF2236 family)